MIRSIIIDDERLAREVLKNYIADYCPDVEVVAMAENEKTAIKAIEQHHPDLVFLDIRMPGGSGFDLLSKLGEITFKVIFVTAYSEYSLKAFRFCAVDYLLKPVNIDELKEAVDRVRKALDTGKDNRNISELLTMTHLNEWEFNTLVIPDKKGFTVVGVGEIIKCEADGYCTVFFLTGNRNITSSKNLKFYEEILFDKGFLRVHNSNLINLHHVKEYISDGVVTLTEKNTAPVGNTYKKKFLDYFIVSK